MSESITQRAAASGRTRRSAAVKTGLIFEQASECF